MNYNFFFKVLEYQLKIIQVNERPFFHLLLIKYTIYDKFNSIYERLKYELIIFMQFSENIIYENRNVIDIHILTSILLFDVLMIEK